MPWAGHHDRVCQVAGDSVAFRDEVLDHGALQPLLHILSNPCSTSTRRNVVWSLSNLCRGKPRPRLEVVLPALSVLAECLRHEDTQVVADSCWALSYLVDNDRGRASSGREGAGGGGGSAMQRVIDANETAHFIDLILGSDIGSTVVDLMDHEQVRVVSPAVRTVGTMVSGSDEQTQIIVDLGALTPVTTMLQVVTFNAHAATLCSVVLVPAPVLSCFVW